jgi:hypothetical protein
VMRDRIEERKAAARAHKAANPKQTYSRPKPPGAHRDGERDGPRKPASRTPAKPRSPRA